MIVGHLEIRIEHTPATGMRPAGLTLVAQGQPMGVSTAVTTQELRNLANYLLTEADKPKEN